MKASIPFMLVFLAVLGATSLAEGQVRHRRPYSGDYILGYGFDNNSRIGVCTDYACGSACYDGHTGSDFWIPFGGAVVAGQAGTVIGTFNGCANYGYRNNPCGGLCGNHVVIRHSDGSRSRYCHMQLGSLRVSTGQSVSCGQRLGNVASSGSSTGPHLHFAYHPPSGGATQEQFAGNCGRSSTRWVRQRAYRQAPGTECGECSAGQTRGCGSDVGACVRGTQGCEGGSWGPCRGGVLARAEECNGQDDNCNGVVDENLRRSCGTNVGECVAGEQSCGAAEWGACVGEVRPTTEVCDLLDNDCDGLPDEEDVCEVEELTQQSVDSNTDIDGDGDADACACGEDVLECHLASGHGFERELLGPAVPSDFDDPAQYSSFRMGDIDGDGRADACLRDENGIRCWRSEEGRFGNELQGPELSDEAGFDQPAYYTTIRLADVNGDGMDDLCARWPDGLRCSFANGQGFGESIWLPALSDDDGFDNVEYYGTLRMADIDGDGRSDVCVRSAGGMICWRASDRGFADSVLGPAWSDDAGFDKLEYWSTIRLADVNGDGRADLCARTPNGFECHPATRTGFADPYLGPALSSDEGWGERSRYSTIRMGDVDGDGRVDLCAREVSGMACWLFTGRGFDQRIEGPALSDAAGWSEASAFRTIRLADVNSDGRADLCGRDRGGFRCWVSAGQHFPIELPGPAWADGWDAPQRFASIRLGSPPPNELVPLPFPEESLGGGCVCSVMARSGPRPTWFLLSLLGFILLTRCARRSRRSQ